MTTFVGHQDRVEDLIYALIELDFDAIEAYRAAISRLKDSQDRAQLTLFLRDHERHTEDLSTVLLRLGGTPPSGPDMKQFLTKGKVIIGSLAGDRAVLLAMKTNEADTNTAYERAAGRADLAPNVREILERNLQDERRHRSWLTQRLEALRAA